MRMPSSCCSSVQGHGLGGGRQWRRRRRLVSGPLHAWRTLPATAAVQAAAVKNLAAAAMVSLGRVHLSARVVAREAPRHRAKVAAASQAGAAASPAAAARWEGWWPPCKMQAASSAIQRLQRCRCRLSTWVDCRHPSLPVRMLGWEPAALAQEKRYGKACPHL